jgi:hypothetical protein
VADLLIIAEDDFSHQKLACQEFHQHKLFCSSKTECGEYPNESKNDVLDDLVHVFGKEEKFIGK